MELSAEIKGHFLMLYEMAITDGEFSQSELVMLYKFAEERGVTETELDQILLNPITEVTIPESVEKRIEFLYDLAQMSWANNEISEDERNTLKKFAKKFEFLEENIEALIEYLIEAAKQQTSIHQILKEINQS